jgi:cyclopropane-fatty-acyl-phospholipid synthase
MIFILRAFLKTVVQRGSLEVETSSGARFSVGDGTGKPLAIRFVDRTAERRLLLNPALALGEGFMDGRILVTKGSIYGVLDLVMSNLGWKEPHALARAWTRVRTAFRYVQQRNDLMRAARNVERHYDLDGRLYDLFLDPDWQYSCAYFELPDQSLKDAQRAK